MRCDTRLCAWALGAGFACASASALAQAAGPSTCQGVFANATGACAAFLRAHGERLLHYPGLFASSMDACFDAGFEVWFSGVAESGATYSGSFAGNTLVLSWQGGRVAHGTCTSFAISGADFVIRPFPNRAADAADPESR